MPKITDPGKLAELNGQAPARPRIPTSPLETAGKVAGIDQTRTSTRNDQLTGIIKTNDISNLPVTNALLAAQLREATVRAEEAETKLKRTGGLPTDEDSRKARYHFSIATPANRRYEGLKIGSRGLLGTIVNNWLPEGTLNQLPEEIGNSPERRIADINELTVINAIARLESGAAIGDNPIRGGTPEFRRYHQEYFPQPGDGPEVRKELAEKRRIALEAVGRRGGLSPEEIQLSTKVGNEFWAPPKLMEGDPTGRTQGTAIHPDYQKDMDWYLAEHPRGTLDPVEYARFRMTLDEKYKYGKSPDDLEIYTKEAEGINDLTRSFNHEIPGPEISANDAAYTTKNTPLTAGVIAAGNSAGLGIPALLQGEEGRAKMAAMETEHPTASFFGNMLGGAAGTEGLGLVGGAAAKKLVPWLLEGGTRKAVGRTIARDTTYGGVTSANEANEGDRVKAALIGATINGGSSLLAQPVAKGLSPLQSQESQDALELLKGIDTTTFQRLGDRAASTEEALGGVPGIRGARERAEISFNQDNMKRALSLAHDPETGVVLELPKGTKPGHASNLAAATMLSGNYDKILPNIQGSVDTPYLDGIAKIWEPFYFPASGKGKPQLRDTALKEKVNNIRSIAERELFDSAGDFDGKAFKSTSIKLRDLASKYLKSDDEDIYELGHAVVQLRENLHDLGMRVNPKLATALKATDAAWARLMRIELASASTAAKGGVYGPPQYMQAIKQLDGSPRKTAMARGKGLDQKYAEAAEKILGSKAPSKIAPWLTGAMLGGTSVVSPVAGATLATMGASAYVPGVKRVTQKILTGDRGKFGRPSADLLSQAVLAKHRTNNSKDK